MVYFSIKFGLGSGSDTRNSNNGNDEKNRSACTAMQYALAEGNRTRASGHHKTAANYLTAMRSLTAFMARADGASDLVFPMLRGVPPGHTHHTYLNRLRAYNYALARLSDMVQTTRRLSSYVARHTWTSMAYTHSLDLQLIAKAMGHTKLSTTLTYIRSLFDPSLADTNRRMIGELGL